MSQESENKELKILKWVGIALAVLSTLFTLAIVGSHLSGRLVGLGRVGIIGTVGAELMAIICAWLIASARKMVAGVAMVCQIVLTAVLLINASVALDLDWQQNQADKASERQLQVQRAAAEEERKTEALRADKAKELAQVDRRAAREFVKGGKVAPTAAPTPEEEAPAPVNVAKLGTYERFGLTTVPLFLALLVVLALSLAAHSGGSVTTEPQPQQPPRPVGFTPPDTPRRPLSRPITASKREEKPRGEFVTTAEKTKTHVSEESSDIEPAKKDTVSYSAEGLKRLREALKITSSYLPGKSFKVDVNTEKRCVWIRLMAAHDSIQTTEASAKAKLSILDEALTMPEDAFRARLEQFLKSKGFEI